MKCTNCQGEWTPPQNVSLSKCPFCQTDVLQSLNAQEVELTPEVILRNMLQVYGMELLQQEQRLSAMISDLFAHDKRTRKILLLSIKEKVPQQLATMLDSSISEQEIRIHEIQHYLIHESFLNKDVTIEIINCWGKVLVLKIEDIIMQKVFLPAFEIKTNKLIRGNTGNSKIDQIIGNMVLVEGGSFQMGSNDHDQTMPIHKVTLNSFRICKYEVTQSDWKEVMNNNPCDIIGETLPVVQVSWNDCQEFITKLCKITKKRFRFPTEAEWEFAARGGNESLGYLYAGSNDVDKVAWYSKNANKTSLPVGRKQPNELGLYDMSGNVEEFCNDWEGEYSALNEINPEGPNSGSGKICRGGNWGSVENSSTVSYRNGCTGINYNNRFKGLRLALSCDE